MSLTLAEIASQVNAQVKFIRIVIPHGVGHGNHAPAVYLYDYLRKVIDFKGQIEFVYDGFDILKISELFNFKEINNPAEPYLLDDKTHFITVKQFQAQETPIEADLVIMGAKSLMHEGWLESFFGKVGISLESSIMNPYGIHTSHTSKTMVKVPLADPTAPSALNWVIAPMQEAAQALQSEDYASLRAKKPGLVELFEAISHQDIDTLPVNGLGKYLTDESGILPEYAIATLLLALAELQKNRPADAQKPLLLLPQYELDSEFLPTLQTLLNSTVMQTAVDATNLKLVFLDVKEPDFAEKLAALPPNAVALAWVGQLPTYLFNALFAGGTFRPVGEGAGAQATSWSGRGEPPIECASRGYYSNYLKNRIPANTMLSAVSKQIEQGLCTVKSPEQYNPKLYQTVAHLLEQLDDPTSQMATEMQQVTETYQAESNDVLLTVLNEALTQLQTLPARITPLVYEAFITAINQNNSVAINDLLTQGHDPFSMLSVKEFSPFAVAIMEGKYDLAWKMFAYGKEDINIALQKLAHVRILFPLPMYEKLKKALGLKFIECLPSNKGIDAACSGSPLTSFSTIAQEVLSTYHTLALFKRDKLPSSKLNLAQLAKSAVFFDDKKAINKLLNLEGALAGVIYSETIQQSKVDLFEYITHMFSVQLQSDALIFSAANADSDFFTWLLQREKNSPIVKPNSELAFQLFTAAINNPDPLVITNIIKHNVCGIKAFLATEERYNNITPSNLATITEVNKHFPIKWPYEALAQAVNLNKLDVVEAILQNQPLDLLMQVKVSRTTGTLLFRTMSDEMFELLWSKASAQIGNKEEFCQRVMNNPEYSKWRKIYDHSENQARVKTITDFCGIAPHADITTIQMANTSLPLPTNSTNIINIPALSESVANPVVTFFNEVRTSTQEMPEVRNVINPLTDGIAYGFTRSGLEEALKATNIDPAKIPALCDLTFSAYAVYSGNYTYAMPLMWRVVAHYFPTLATGFGNAYTIGTLCWQLLSIQSPADVISPLIQLGSRRLGVEFGTKVAQCGAQFFASPPEQGNANVHQVEVDRPAAVMS